ncbi:MAG: bacteriohemerythrin [Spirochaetaceae bacterium]|nr:bacteriohemerythrin [Spirochaetaceae bacterium]
MEPYVVWEDVYATGISIIDLQHQQLFALTNELYESCREENKIKKSVFRKAIRHAVDYIKFHFSTEEQILEAINYAEIDAHKKEHREFVRTVLDAAKDFEDGNDFAPNEFVRYLRNWVLRHIAIEDKKGVSALVQLNPKKKAFG